MLTWSSYKVRTEKTVIGKRRNEGVVIVSLKFYGETNYINSIWKNKEE